MNTKNKLVVLSLSAGHFINDAYSNFLGPLLPLLMDKLQLTITQAGWLVAILVISSSLTQPVYGYISDRYSRRAFAVFSPLITAVFMSCLGLATSFGMLALLLTLGGVGIASFHPQGAAITSMAGQKRKGLAMSVFVTSGSIGYALGPIFIITAVNHFGLEGSYLVILPGLVAFTLLYSLVPGVEHSHREQQSLRLREAVKMVWRPLLVLYLLVVIRSAVQMCFVNFLPLFLHHQRGLSPEAAARITSAFLFCGAVGGFTGGGLADRFGGKAVISLSMLLSVPCFSAFIMTQGGTSYFWLGMGGLILLSTIPVNVVMAQDLIPQNASVASALTMGFAWGLGGMVVPLIGKVADIAGLASAFLLVISLPVAGFVLSLDLPGKKRIPVNL